MTEKRHHVYVDCLAAGARDLVTICFALKEASMAKKNAAGQRPGTAAGRASKQDPQSIAQELSETAADTVRDAVHAAQTVGGDVTRLARQAGAGAVQAADLLRAATARLARSVADAAQKPTPGGNATTRAKRTARPAQARRKRSSQ